MKIKNVFLTTTLAASLVAVTACDKSAESTDTAVEVDQEAATETIENTAEEAVEVTEEIAEEAVAAEPMSKNPDAQKLMDASIAATEQYADLMGSIKDEESAKTALAKFDDLGGEYEKIAEMAKGMDQSAVTPEQGMEMQKTMMERMQPIQERMQTNMVTAMQVLGANPDLMKEFQEKSMALADKMQKIQQNQ